MDRPRPGRVPATLFFLGLGVAAASLPASPLLTGGPAEASTVPSAAQPTVQSGGTPLVFDETWSTTLPDAGQPIALSSPTVADLGGSPSVVVADRRGYVYAYHLGGNAAVAVPGWPATDGSGPVDSAPSVAPGPLPAGAPAVFVGSGNDADPDVGGYQAFTASGTLAWFTPVTDPASDTQPATGVEAGMSVGVLQGGATDVMAGSLGQQAFALAAANGSVLTGWPFFDSDSTHSTAALADLFGNGVTEAIVGGDQTAGAGRGQQYTQGGHLRILSPQGNLICRADTDQVVDSSPAVGGFLAGGQTGIVTGTGSYFAGAPDSDKVIAYDTHCDPVWSTTLDGDTYSSPALADIAGNGSFEVAETTDQVTATGPSGSIWVLAAATGRPLWHQSGLPEIIGSPVTADLTGLGYQDVLVPTINGTFVYDGRTGGLVATLDPVLGLQSSPLVTADPNGTIGITLAGYAEIAPGKLVGKIEHYEIPGSDGALAVGAGSWPEFHHDPQLTGDAGGTPAPSSVPPCAVPAAATPLGYDLFAGDGGVFSFGGSPFCGSTGALRLDAPVVGVAMAPATGGYWEVASDGGVFAFGGAGFYGSMGGHHLDAPIVGMAATPDGKGYWLVAADGGVFAFGDASFDGSMGGTRLDAPIVGMSATADGKGYRLVASDGGIFAFGDAPFLGSMGGMPLNRPIVATATDPDTGGYWEVASDGGVFAFGAPFLGSMGGRALVAPIVGMTGTANGSGYRLVASDGGLFSFGAPFYGSMGGRPLHRPIVAVAGF